MSLSLFKEKNIIIVVFISAAIFMVDLFTPLWYDVWVLYLIPLFFMYQSAKRPYLYSVIVTLLITVGLFVSHSDSTPLMHAAVNRITGIFGGWGVSFLLMRLKRLHLSVLQSRNELENRVEERTDELLQVNRMLQEDIAERKKIEEEKGKLIVELRNALDKVKQLNGLLPICSSCKKIRDDKGYWIQIEAYIHTHSDAQFSHGICPECTKKLYPQYYDQVYGEDSKEEGK